MELLQLKYFCDAAITENFSITAKKYDLPTSAISQTIKRLENELGVKLFDRNANKVTLNEQGELFYNKVNSALNIFEDAKKQVCKSNDEIPDNITLLIRTNRRVVTKAIELYKVKNPNVNFIIKHSCDSESEIFDICIDDRNLDLEIYEKHLLIRENIFLALKKGHPLEKITDLSPCDLSDEKFITMTSSSSLFRITKETCLNLGFEPNIIIQCDDPFYIRRYVELGLGVAFVPMCSWQGLFSKNIFFKNIGNITRKTYFYINKKRKSSIAINNFCELLSQIAEI